MKNSLNFWPETVNQTPEAFNFIIFHLITKPVQLVKIKIQVKIKY